MKFPTEYKALSQNIFSEAEYRIVPIRYEDRIDIMKWRNEQMYHLRQAQPLTSEDQESYFKNTIAKLFEEDKPKQLLFSYLKNDVCIGYGGLVHINWTDRNAEISFIMDTALEKEFFEFHWKMYLSLIEQVAFIIAGLHKIYTYAFDLRPQLYKIFLDAEFKEEARLKEHCFFNKKFIDIIIHSKIR